MEVWIQLEKKDIKECFASVRMCICRTGEDLEYFKKRRGFMIATSGLGEGEDEESEGERPKPVQARNEVREGEDLEEGALADDIGGGDSDRS